MSKSKMTIPPNKNPLPKLYALLSVDSDGNEGIMMLATAKGTAVAVTGEYEIAKKFAELMMNVEAIDGEIRVGEYTRSATHTVEEF